MYTYIFIHIICMIAYNRTIYMICLVIIQITHCKLAKKCVDTYTCTLHVVSAKQGFQSAVSVKKGVLS